VRAFAAPPEAASVELLNRPFIRPAQIAPVGAFLRRPGHGTMTSITGTLAAASGLPPVPMYLAYSKNEQALVKKFGQSDPQAKADTTYLQQRAPKLGTVNDLMKDYRALGIVLKAFGMSDQLAYPGLVRKLITEDPTSKTSTAQRIGNATYLRFAKAMGQYKSNPFTDPTNLAAVTDAYVLNRYEAMQGQNIPGMEQALAFKRQASQITSIAQLMTSPSLLKVAVTQTGIDYTTFGIMDYDRQVALLTRNVKLADLKNAKKVDGMAETYLVAAAQSPDSWGAATSTGNTVASLFGVSSNTSILSLFA
jgi:hypothetical protein